jgi:SAM-dependent methyltransferase
MADWYRDGAGLSEQLSRLLFLEATLADRRVLEVGDLGPLMAEYLAELGAKKVVTALSDKARLEQIRRSGEHAGADFRLVRDGVLPGDDGAFDLVIDFGLAAALARGETWRLDEVHRLLSPDGFALTALASGQTPGLPALLSRDKVPSPPLGYRALAETLTERFEVVQVYFQSLLLGFFFGSFDMEPGEEGIAPHTGLMGEEAEPAAYYLFTFGNAVPVLEDVSLVQIPFASIAERLVQERGRTRDDVEMSERLAHLKRDNAFKEHALIELAGRVPHLKAEVDALLLALEARTREREDLVGGVRRLQAALLARDARLVEATAKLERAVVYGSATEAELARRAEFIEERQSWFEGGRAEVERLEGEVEAARALQAEAAAAARAFAQQSERGELERARLRERALSLETALQGARGLFEELKDERDGLREEVRRLAADLEALGGAALEVVEREQLEAKLLGRAAEEQRQLEAALDDTRQRLEQAQRDLEAAAEEREASRQRADEQALELRTQLEEARRELRVAMEAPAEAEAEPAPAPGAAEGTTLEKLAKGVNRLMQERDKNARRAQESGERMRALESRLVEAAAKHAAELAALEQELAQARSKLHESERALVQEQAAHKAALERFKAAQAALAVRGKELGKVAESSHEATAQRDALQKVVATRDREIAALKDDLASATGELARLAEEAKAAQKARVDAEERSTALEQRRAEVSRSLAEGGGRDGGASFALVLESERGEHDKTRETLEETTQELLAAVEEAEHLRGQVAELDRRVRQSMPGAALLEATLEEAQQRLATERARGDLFAAQLEEARLELTRRKGARDEGGAGSATRRPGSVGTT